MKIDDLSLIIGFFIGGIGSAIISYFVNKYQKNICKNVDGLTDKLKKYNSRLKVK